MTDFHIAEINIGRIKGVTMNDPVMKEFVDNLDTVNAIAEQSEGFVWRLKDDSNNATNINPYNDEQVIVNVSVWQNIAALEQYMYKTVHSDFLRRRKEWFHAYGKMHVAMWWVEAGHIPTLEEAVGKLKYLEENGPTQQAFNFKRKFPSP